MFHVAEAGSLGGGILSYLAGSESASDDCFILELLRTRAIFNRSRSDGVETVMLSGSEGVDIWLSRSGAGVKIALCV